MRRSHVVLALGAAGAVALWLAAARWLWTPLDDAWAGSRVPPELAAPLRTDAEHDELYAAARWPLALELEPGGRRGAALVLGFQHTDDPADAQIAALRERFAAFGPTLVLVEGRLGWAVGGLAGATARFGESGAAAALARAADVRCETLEPAFDLEARDAAAVLGAERALAFYFLRVFVSDRDRGELGADVDAAAERLLAKRARRTGLEGTFRSLAALDAFWRSESANAGEWRELPAEALWRDADGSWLARVAERVNAFRDRAMVARIAEAVDRGERVLAVVGGSHLVLFEPALRAALGGDPER